MYVVFEQSLATAFAFVAVEYSCVAVTVLVGDFFGHDAVARYIVLCCHSQLPFKTYGFFPRSLTSICLATNFSFLFMRIALASDGVAK